MLLPLASSAAALLLRLLLKFIGVNDLLGLRFLVELLRFLDLLLKLQLILFFFFELLLLGILFVEGLVEIGGLDGDDQV